MMGSRSGSWKAYRNGILQSPSLLLLLDNSILFSLQQPCEVGTVVFLLHIKSLRLRGYTRLYRYFSVELKQGPLTQNNEFSLPSDRHLE